VHIHADVLAKLFHDLPPSIAALSRWLLKPQAY
jgi:hypothetical protein